MQAEEDAVIRAGELTMDQDTHEVLVGDVPVELSPTEFKLLRYLMLNPNRVLSKAQILDHVWEYDFNGDAGIVESYISYLRRKLDQHSTRAAHPDQARIRLHAEVRQALTQASPPRLGRACIRRFPSGGTASRCAPRSRV